MSSQAIAERFVVRAEQAPISLPVRNLLLTFALTIFALAGAGLLWRSMGHPILIVAMGWPHIIPGFLFILAKSFAGRRGRPSCDTQLCAGTEATNSGARPTEVSDLSLQSPIVQRRFLQNDFIGWLLVGRVTACGA